jgi:arabinose-5-phosphate isomerase
MVAVDGHLAGVLTTGDLTRLAERDPKFFDRRLSDVMTRTPRTSSPDDLAGAAVGVMQERGIIVLPVVDERGAIVGVVHLHDLMRAGAV